MNKQSLYIITGLPYSGKTTLTNELVKKFGFSTASVDEFIKKGKYVVDTMVQDDWNNVYSQAFRKLEKELARGRSVVFDGGSLKRSERDRLKSIAENVGVNGRLIYVKTSVDLIKKRQQENKGAKTRGHVTDKVLSKAMKMFEEPTKDENMIVYEYPADLGDWIENNI